MSDREFFDRVATLGYAWHQTPNGLRTVAGKCPSGMCPLTALAFSMTGREVSTWEIRTALRIIGVSAQFGFEISRCADPGRVTFSDYRARLFQATGV